MAKQYLESGLRKYGGQDVFDWQDWLNDNEVTDRFMTAIMAKIVPVGTILSYGGQPDVNNDPPGFLYLTPGGREVSRATYAALFAVLGTTYGSGNGTTTFKLPDLADRVPLGYSANRKRGTIGGSSTHTLSESELPSLKKAVRYGTWNLKFGLNGSTNEGYNLHWDGPRSAPNEDEFFVLFGGGQSHNNMQPNIALVYIIKF